MRGLNALLATVSTDQVAPVIAAQRLRKGAAGSPRGAARLATDALALVRPQPAGRPGRAGAGGLGVLLPRPGRRGAERGAEVSITVRMDPAVKRAIAAIDEDAWTTIKYTDAVYDETTGSWISKAQVAEVPSPPSPRRRRPSRFPGG